VSYTNAPTRAEAERDEMPTGTRRLCEYCGCTPAEADFRSCVQPGERRPGEHSFREFPLCSSCGGKGGSVQWRPGDAAPDPQTEVLCDRCEGHGVEGLV
jgi:hypothetical protein